MQNDNDRRPGPFKLFSLLALAAAASSQAPPAPAHALRFEVASVKPALPLDPQKLASGQQRIGLRVDAARVDISRMGLAGLIRNAFHTKPYEVSGPDWLTASPLSASLFDVHATLPEGATEKDVPEMLQALLVERFGLKFHRESQAMAIYALVIAKGGAKMKDSPPDEPVAAAPGGGPGGEGNDKPPPVTERSDGRGGVVVRNSPAGTMKGSVQDGIVHMEIEKMSMSGLAEMLTAYLDRPVVDMTELKGNYQVALDAAQADLMNSARRMGMPMRPGAGEAPPEAPDTAVNPIFHSVQQLGLKLEARKADIQKLVIDHLEKTPSEN